MSPQALGRYSQTQTLPLSTIHLWLHLHLFSHCAIHLLVSFMQDAGPVLRLLGVLQDYVFRMSEVALQTWEDPPPHWLG